MPDNVRVRVRVGSPAGPQVGDCWLAEVPAAGDVVIGDAGTTYQVMYRAWDVSRNPLVREIFLVVEPTGP